MTSLVTAFAYNQIVHSILPETSDYEISNRWNFPMLQNNIALYKNSTQTVLLEVRSLSNKLLKVLDRDFYLNIIDNHNGSLAFRRVATVVDENKGRLSFVLQPTDTDNLAPGSYLFSVSAIDVNGLETFLFLDQTGGATGDVILYDKALPGFVPSFLVNVFGAQFIEGTSYEVSSAYPGDGQFKNTDGQHTVAIYLDNWTGKFYIQASLMADPGEMDWFDVIISEQFSYANYVSYSGVEAFNFYGPVYWVRLKYYNDPMNEGEFTQAYYRAVNQPNPDFYVGKTHGGHEHHSHDHDCD